MAKKAIIHQKNIENRIFTVRGQQVMLDSHLAELYEVETKNLNKAVARNIERFPEDFRFQLSAEDYENLRFHFGTSSGEHGGRRYLPYVYTEQGVAMLSGILKSDVAVQVNIKIMRAFVEMRKTLTAAAGLFQRMDKLEMQQMETDKKFKKVFDALQKHDIPQQGIFFEGRVFDAYNFVAGLIRKAKKSIVVVDNYVDDTVLTLLGKRKKGVGCCIYTRTISKQLQLDIAKYNEQYAPIGIKELKAAHDRFLILDEKELYHIGASLKDLGKKWFAFSKMDKGAVALLNKLNEIKNA